MRFQRIVLAFAAMAAATLPVSAGEIYGKIHDGAAPAGANATVEIKCGAKSYPALKTDATGSYHLTVQESGKCTLTVKLGDRSASLEVVSFDDPVQFDVVVETKDGKTTARRK